VSETGSLAQAAKRLEVDHTTVGRRVEAIERTLGLKLFTRTTAGYVRTLDAERLLELAASGVQSLLVLPANAQLAWLDSAVGDYRPARPVAAVVTKIDETVSLGEAIGVLLREGIPLAYLTDGPDIPDDLRVGSATEIARLALALGEAGEEHAARQGRPAVRSPNAARIA
jgi:hypothetical protein